MKKIILKIKCTRCQYEFWPKIDDKTDEIVMPKACRNQTCRSPYYLKKKTRMI